jgi:hypothetical protein
MPIKLATPRRAHIGRARRGAGVAVSAVACAALIGACGSSNNSTSTTTTKATNLDTTRVARSIETSILTERHLHAVVVCPPVVAQETGKTFECVATTHSAKHPTVAIKTPFVVTVQSNKGYVTYVGK